MEDYEFRQWKIRGQMVEALQAYIDKGQPVGEFLMAILSNDFVTAAGFADDDNLANLQAYAAFLYNEVPRALWGSKQKVEKWISVKE